MSRSSGGDATPTPGDATEAPAPRLDEPPADVGQLPRAPMAPPGEEVDVWWGSYAFRGLLPALAASLVLTALIAWGSWLFVPHGWKELAFISLGSLLWAGQALRGCHRYFGYNYRLTTHRLFRDRGVLRPHTIRVNLADVAHVAVRRFGLDRLGGLAQIRITLEDSTYVVLEGIAHSAQVVELLRSAVQKARERNSGHERSGL